MLKSYCRAKRCAGNCGQAIDPIDRQCLKLRAVGKSVIEAGQFRPMEVHGAQGLARAEHISGQRSQVRIVHFQRL